LGRQPGAGVVAPAADLRDELEVLRVGIERVADQVVDDVRPVVLRGVDVVDAELDRASKHGPSTVGVARWPEHAGTGELHRAEADAVDWLVAQVCGLHVLEFCQPVPACCAVIALRR
jgi:hypothetical protein